MTNFDRSANCEKQYPNCKIVHFHPQRLYKVTARSKFCCSADNFVSKFQMNIPLFAFSVKSKQFFDILSPLAKWNMIICLLGTFLENALKKTKFLFPLIGLALYMHISGELCLLFLQASCTMHVLFSRVALTV